MLSVLPLVITYDICQRSHKLNKITERYSSLYYKNTNLHGTNNFEYFVFAYIFEWLLKPIVVKLSCRRLNSKVFHVNIYYSI